MVFIHQKELVILINPASRKAQLNGIRDSKMSTWKNAKIFATIGISFAKNIKDVLSLVIHLLLVVKIALYLIKAQKWWPKQIETIIKSLVMQ